MADESASKTEEPTPKKLADARKKGDVAKSMDIPQLASLAGAFGVMAIGGGWFLRDMAMQLLPFVAHPDEIELSGQGAMQVVVQAGLAAAPLTVTVLAGAGVAGGIGYLAQTGFMLTGEKLKPEAKKISPLEGFKRIFGVEGLVQFLKSVLKIAVTGWVAWLVLKPRAADLSALASMEPAAMLPLSADLIRALFYAVMTFLALTAGLDWFWQRQRFTARMRMSREELKEEYKQSDGDPHVKAKQKQIRAERSRRRMMQNVPNATVVIMNPTHYAVALRYEAGQTAAPECVAKGVDDLALRIRALAEDSGVAVIEDPPLARALYAAVDVDQQIPEAHFEAVAKIIGFVMSAAQRRAGAPRARPL
jgi:flagellar biosynthetic protein FlhB